MKKSRNAEKFSERLEIAMENAGVSQADLARKLGTAWSTVARWRGGSLPRTKTIREIATVLCVASRWLESGEGDQVPSNQGAKPLILSDLEELASKAVSETTFVQRISILADLYGSDPNVARGLKLLILAEVDRQAKEFFSTVRHLAEWASKATAQIQDEETALEIQISCEQILRSEPEMREWLAMLIDQDKTALAASDPPPEESAPPARQG